MKDQSDDPSHHERTLLPWSYISLPFRRKFTEGMKCLITHSTHFILYGFNHTVGDYSDSEKRETHCHNYTVYSFWLAAIDLLYAPSNMIASPATDTVTGHARGCAREQACPKHESMWTRKYSFLLLHDSISWVLLNQSWKHWLEWETSKSIHREESIWQMLYHSDSEREETHCHNYTGYSFWLAARYLFYMQHPTW